MKLLFYFVFYLSEGQTFRYASEIKCKEKFLEIRFVWEDFWNA